MTTSELMFQVETEVMANLLKELQKGLTTPASWKVDRLKAMGKFTDSNIKLINKYKNGFINSTTQSVIQASTDTLKTTDTIYKSIGEKVPEVSEGVKRVQAAYIKQGVNDMNYTSASLLKSAKKVYKDSISVASYKYVQGITTLDEALKETCSKWINAGSLGIKDSAGREWSPESYSRMVLRTNNRNVTTETTFARNKDYGNTLIEISSHAGAREGCAPYQGKIYDTAGKSEKYQSLASTTYGEPAGIGGINCRHDFFVYIEGVSVQSFYPKPFDEKEYKLTQEQRKNERTIRNATRKLELQKLNGGNTSLAENTLKRAQENQEKFIKDTGRKRYPSREKVIL